MADAPDLGSGVLDVKVQVLLGAPAASCRPQESGGDSKDPNLITRWLGSDLSLYAAPKKAPVPKAARFFCANHQGL